MKARRDVRGVRAGVALGAALLLALAACSSGSGGGDKSEKVARRGTDADIPSLTWAVTSAPRSLDSAHAFDTSSAIVTTELMDPVLGIDSQGKLQPRLAESWQTPDNTTIVLKIRQGVTFWDGAPLTAEDVAYSLKRNLDPEVASEMAVYYRQVDTIEATGDDEVTISLKAPDPRFIFSLQLALIVEKKYAEAHRDDLGTPTGLTMGTGAYEVESFSTATGVTLKRNDDYWGRKPKVQKLTIKAISDSENLRLAAQSGNIDGTFQVPVELSAGWDKLKDVAIDYVPGEISTFLSLNVNKPPFDDIHARKALAYALDREGIVKALYAGHAKAAPQTIVQPTLFTSSSKAEIADFYDSLPDYSFDLKKARAELAQSATPDGFSVNVVYPDGRPYLGKMLQTLAQNVSKFGITIRVKEVTTADWLTQTNAKDRPTMGVMALRADFPSPASLALAVLSPKGQGGNQNYADYMTPAAEKATEDFRGGDAAQQLAAVRQMATALSQDLPYVPVTFQTGTVALSTKFAYTGDYSSWTIFGQEWASNIRVAAE